MDLIDEGHELLAEVYEQTVFRVACDEGCLDIIKGMLQSGRRFDQGTIFDGFITAARHGYAEMVEYFIEEQSVDPAAGHNMALDVASRQGNVSVIHVLCKYDQVLQCESSVRILEKALEKGQYSVAQLLWAPIQRFQELDIDKLHEILGTASVNGYTKTVALMLSHPSVIPSFNEGAALRFACIKGRFDIVKLFLKDPGVLACDCTDVAHSACINGHLDVFRLLLLFKARLGFEKAYPDEFKTHFLLVQNIRNAPTRGLGIFTERFHVHQEADMAVLDWALLFYCLRGTRENISRMLKYASGILASNENTAHKFGSVFLRFVTWIIAAGRAEVLPNEIVRHIGRSMVMPIIEKYKI